MKFIDLFAGIGGFRLGMQQAGHTPVGWCEKDKFAQKSYRAIHNTEGEWFSDDIRTVEPDELPEFEVICAGFPCQSFSIAGKQGGSRIHEELYSLKWSGWLKPESLNIFSLKMSKGYLHTITEKLSQQSSSPYQSWGTMQNGKLLTAEPMSVKTDQEHLLLDILEENPNQKYFLSKQKQKTLLKDFKGI